MKGMKRGERAGRREKGRVSLKRNRYTSAHVTQKGEKEARGEGERLTLVLEKKRRKCRREHEEKNQLFSYCNEKRKALHATESAKKDEGPSRASAPQKGGEASTKRAVREKREKGRITPARNGKKKRRERTCCIAEEDGRRLLEQQEEKKSSPSRDTSVQSHRKGGLNT